MHPDLVRRARMLNRQPGAPDSDPARFDKISSVPDRSLALRGQRAAVSSTLRGSDRSMNVRGVDWFYVQNGSQVGPVPAAQFDDLVRSGQIRPETLVWRAGLANWQPFGSVAATPSSVPSQAPRPLPAGAPPVTPALPTNCAECGYSFAQSEMISYGDAWICARCKPVFIQRIREGAPLASGGANVWRNGASLVTVSGTALPLRCAKCANPVTGQPIPRTLYWHQPWIYLLIFLCMPAYLIVALIARAKASVDIPVCEHHRKMRHVAILVSWLLFVLGLVGFVVGTVQLNATWGDAGSLAACVLLSSSALLALSKGTLVTASKIDGDYVWVSGFSKEYLESLPEFPDYR